MIRINDNLTLKPALSVIAGPNGSGKTTITKQFLSHEWGASMRYINADEIAEGFGSWNDYDSIIKAANEADRLRELCLLNNENFAFETVFSSKEKLEFVQKVQSNGYFVRLFFVATADPAINIDRVTNRFVRGGHEVPKQKIIDRYYGSMKNLATIVPLLNRVYIYDNSIDNKFAKLICRFNDGKFIKQYNPAPKWVQDLSIIPEN